MYRKRITLKYKYLVLAAFLIITSIGLFYLYTYKKDSADGRLVIWKTTLLVIKNNFLTGIGFNQFSNKIADYQAVYFEQHPKEGMRFADKIDYAFNDPLHLTAENGIVGLLLFAAFLISTVWFVIRSEKDNPFYVLAALLGMLCILISGLFSYPMEMISIRFLFFFFCLLISVHHERLFHLTKKISITLYFIFLCMSIYALSYQNNSLISRHHVNLAQSKTHQAAYSASSADYELALKYTPHEKKILLGLGLSLLKQQKYVDCVSVLSDAMSYISDPYLQANLGLAYENLNKYSQAEYHYLTAQKMLPNKLYFKYLQANMYFKTKEIPKAKKIAKDILMMPVRISSTAVFEMQSEMKKILNASQ